MAHDVSGADDRYRAGAVRDDAADDRDAASRIRDHAAARRDAAAQARDADARRAEEDLDKWLRHARQQLLDRFARVDDLIMDPGDWPDLTTAGLARMRAHAAEQRHLASIDRAAARDLIDELRRKIRIFADNRHAAARDRDAAARDRRGAAEDRGNSARDRQAAAKDRGQSVIDHELAGPDDLLRVDQISRAPVRQFDRDQILHAPDSMIGGSAKAMANSERQIAATRALLAHDGWPATRSTPTARHDGHGPGPAAS